jgi:hypothetical protein
MGVVATPMFSLTAFALIACRAYSAGFQTLCGTLFLATVAIPALHVQCKRYAIAQVRDITADPTRAAAVRAAFDELRAANLERRRAA